MSYFTSVRISFRELLNFMSNLSAFFDLFNSNKLPQANLVLIPSIVNLEILKVIKNSLKKPELVETGNHPDILVIDATSKVEAIKSRLKELNYMPRFEDKKLILFENTSKANKQTFNSLLKLLEEPVSWCIFILLAESISQIPITIVSRCVVWSSHLEDIKKFLNSDSIFQAELKRIPNSERLEPLFKYFLERGEYTKIIDLFEEVKDPKNFLKASYLTALDIFSRNQSKSSSNLCINLFTANQLVERKHTNPKATLMTALELVLNNKIFKQT